MNNVGMAYRQVASSRLEHWVLGIGYWICALVSFGEIEPAGLYVGTTVRRKVS
jgi:hypothetical protein